jgi:hypothetical protein
VTRAQLVAALTAERYGPIDVLQAEYHARPVRGWRNAPHDADWNEIMDRARALAASEHLRGVA